MRKILIASDHAGFKLKEIIKTYLSKKKIKVIDLGPSKLVKVDYPDYAHKLSKKINENPPLAHVIILEEKFKEYGFNLINKLRKKEIKTTFDYKYNLKKSLKNANINNTKFAIIIGENEFNNNNLSVKSLFDGKQKKMSLDEVFKLLRK